MQATQRQGRATGQVAKAKEKAKASTENRKPSRPGHHTSHNQPSGRSLGGQVHRGAEQPRTPSSSSRAAQTDGETLKQTSLTQQEEEKTGGANTKMELFVSTTASARAAAPLSFAPLRRGGSPSVVAPLRRRRRLPARGWRAASAAVPDPVPSEEPASAFSTVVVTDKPNSPAAEEGAEESSASSASFTDKTDSPADEKVAEESSAFSASVEATVAAPASSGASVEDNGLDDILSKLDIEVTPTLILTGSGAFVTLWVMLSVVSAIDSIPLLPKLLELVGIGFSAWFIYRYLLFKGSRDELFAKFEDLKQRII